jgi:hypothetical protein
MTLQSERVAVSTVAVLLGSGGGNGISITVSNPGGPAVFLGGSAVAGSTGFQLLGTATWGPALLDRGDALYGIAASGTATLHVLRGGV